MKKQYFKHLPKFKKQISDCQSSFLQPIKQTFQRIKLYYNLLDCVKLQNLLQTQKQIKPLEDNLKKQLFKFFLQKQFTDFQFLKSRSKVVIRILKITKIKLDDVKYDWLQIWKRILNQFPEIPRKQNFQLQQFLKIIKIFYDQNNAIDVFNYFISKHGEQSDYVFTYILTFANITINTTDEIFYQFLEELFECYLKAQIKSKTLLVYFLNLMKKRKTAQLPQQRYRLLNNIILAGIITPSSKDAKNSIQAKFTKESAIMISQFIGKHNKHSVQTIKMLFNIAQKFINPFENSTRAVRFLYNLIRFVWKRSERESKARERLQRLIERQRKMEQKEVKKGEIQVSNEQQTRDEGESLQENESKLEVNEHKKGVQGPKVQGKETPDDKTQESPPNQEDDDLNQEQEDIESEDQKDKDEGVDEELNQAEQEQLSNEIQQKKNKCLRILKNQITDQILDAVKDGAKRLFNYVYFVNSKKTVQQFIRYSFIMIPELIIKSLNLLDKASQIPYINQEGLVLNIKITVQYMFTPNLFKQSLNNLQRILDRIINCSKIIEVWPIYEILFGKIPILDQKDLQKVSDSDKELFEKKFDLNHDRFYQMYSGNIFNAFKRMIRQGQFFDQETIKSNVNCFEELLMNSYPYFKKTLLSQIIQQITENRKNQFVYNFFNSHFVLSPINEEILLEQLNLLTDNNSDEILQLKNNLVMLLCYNKPLSQLKKYIRQFAQKSSFRVIPMYHAIKADFQLTVEPLASSLNYIDENPKFKFKTSKTTQNRLLILQQLRSYADQLISQLHKLALSPSSSTNISVHQQQIQKDQKSNKQIVDTITHLYQEKSQNQSSVKISLQNVGTRKKITELLKLIYSIQGYLKHKVIDFDNQTMKFKLINPLTQRKSLIENKKFVEVLYTIISNENYLHDIKLTAILSQLVTHQLVFNYGNQTRQCKQTINKCALSNSYQQLPQFVNMYLAKQSFKQRIKLIQSAILLNEVKKQRAQWLIKKHGQTLEINNQQYFEKILNEIKILTMAPGNQKSVSLIKAMLITTGLKGVSDFILNLFRKTHLQSRFYWQKVNQIFEEFKSYGINFTVEELIELIDNHGKLLILKENKKIKELTLKSFKNIVILIKEQEHNVKQYNQFNNIQKIQKILRKYADHQKFKLIWLLSVNIVLISRKFTHFKQDHDKLKIQKIESIWDFMQIIQPMIMSQTRIVRRIALFIYSLCYRKVKKIVRVSEIKEVQKLQYKPKTIIQFIESGYLREDHISQENKKIQVSDGKIANLKCNDNLMKISPYQDYQISVINKVSEIYQLYKKIQNQAYQFIFKDQNISHKFISNFHTDMVSTAEQLLSMGGSSQKPTEISQLVVKQLQESFYYFVPKKLKFDKVQTYFGQRFFKYFLIKDAKNDFKVLFNSKIQQLLSKSLTNLEALDNQALILITSNNVISAYQKTFNQLNQQIKRKVEKFILNIYSQTAKKSSGSIFKKWGLIFKRVESLKALQFLLDYMRGEIYKQKKRVCRNGLVYLTIKQNDFQQHINVLKVLLQNKIQLENSIVNKIINTILTQPQKYTIQKQLALKYKFIDFEKELKENTIEKSTERTYFIKNTQFKDYLIKILKSYISSETSKNQSQKKQSYECLKNQKISEIDQKSETQNKEKNQKQSNQDPETTKNQKNQKFNQFIKNAFVLILNAINCFCHCFQSQQNSKKISQLIDLIYQMSLSKEQTQTIDYKQLQPILKTIFNYQFQDVNNFNVILNSTLKLIKVLPSKRQVQILTIILHRPYNFTMLSQQRYKQLVYEVFVLEQTNNNYKQLMTNLSVIFSFRMVEMQNFVDLIAQKNEILQTKGKSKMQKLRILLKNKKTKGKVILLYQCQQLALLKLDKQGTGMILNECPKERKNIWCRQMLSLRGKKQYLDDQETYHIWQKIKQNSNPYNYIV